MQATGDTVTQLSLSAFAERDSELYFPVAERVDGWQDKNGVWHRDPSVKKLIRMAGNKPVVLATVGHGYRVIKNVDLFTYVEQHMSAKFEPRMLHDVQIKDEMAYNGRDCFRHYTFPSIRSKIGRDEGDVAFKIVVGNGYGSKAVQFIVGAMDYVCSNGTIIGVHEKVARKHTSGMTLSGLDQWLIGSIEMFTKHTDRMQQWATTQIGVHETAMFEHLTDKGLISIHQSHRLYESTVREWHVRSLGQPMTLWHFYSALTRWATHEEVRNTGNDHGAVTRIERGRHVERVINAAHTFVRNAARAA